MARYNEILVGRFARSIQKLFGVKGEVPVASLAGEIIVVHALQSGSENRYLEGWDRFGFTTNIGPAGAGNNSALMLRNPLGSNVVVVFEKLVVFNTLGLTGNPTVQRGTGLADLPTSIGLTTNRLLDSRGRQTPTLIASSTSAAVGAGSTGISFARNPFIANTISEVITSDIHELPMSPNENLQIIENVVNQGVSVSIWWRERSLEEGERS